MTEQFSGFITITTLVVSNWIFAGGAVNKFNLIANREELRYVTNIVEVIDYYDGGRNLYEQINNFKYTTNFDLLLDVRYKSISGSLIDIDAFWSGDMINVFPSNPPVLYPPVSTHIVMQEPGITTNSKPALDPIINGQPKSWWTSNANRLAESNRKVTMEFMRRSAFGKTNVSQIRPPLPPSLQPNKTNN